MEIRKARAEDLDRIMEIYHNAQDFMIAHGNPTQWAHVYPKRSLIEQDIAQEISYVLCNRDIVLAVFALMSGEDPTYAAIEDGAWLNDGPYLTSGAKRVFHKIALDVILHSNIYGRIWLWRS